MIARYLSSGCFENTLSPTLNVAAKPPIADIKNRRKTKRLHLKMNKYMQSEPIFRFKTGGSATQKDNNYQRQPVTLGHVL